MKALAYKYVLVGDSGVGKSCLLYSLLGNPWSDTHQVTLGIESAVHRITIGGTKVTLLIYDTAGQELYRSICKSYYRAADVVLIVYDVTREETFNNVPSWLDEVEKNSTNQPIVILIGNKSDSESERRVSFKTGKAYADEEGLLFAETSAKLQTNVKSTFEEGAAVLITERRNTSGEESKNNIILDTNQSYNNAKKNKCC